jgi:hypothetical protein
MQDLHAPNQPTAMVAIVKRVCTAVRNLGRERKKRWTFLFDPDDGAHP